MSAQGEVGQESVVGSQGWGWRTVSWVLEVVSYKSFAVYQMGAVVGQIWDVQGLVV